MQRELGELNAKVDTLLETGRRSEEKSDASRASMHRRVDELVDRTAKVELSVSALQEDVKDRKPVTDEMRRWKLIGLGALGMRYSRHAFARDFMFCSAASRSYARWQMRCN
jgi:Protein of unknown function (DUF1515).